MNLVIKSGALLVLGLSAPLWWTWASSKLTYYIYLWSDSPERPTRTLLWSSIYLPSLLLGLVTGAVVVTVQYGAPLRGWIMFFGGLLFSTLVIGFWWGQPIEIVTATFGSVGNWIFFIGSAVLPVAVWVTRRIR